MTDEELIELTNNIIDCINADGKLPMHSSAVLMNMVLRLKSRPEPKWISVDEWLPGIGYESQHRYTSAIIILTDGKQVFTGYYERYRNINTFCDVNGNHFKDRNIIVTHWMHLPAPPTTKGAQG